MTQRLPYGDEEKGENPRRDFDQSLLVDGWDVPGPAPTHVVNRPDWWQGDEEASQSFLAAMGVKL